MIFAKPMDTSHVVVETENKHGIPETLYLLDALKVNDESCTGIDSGGKIKVQYSGPRTGDGARAGDGPRA